MEGKCCKYERMTKYECLECFTFVWNICSKIREDHDIYNKEEKLIGKCENCDGNQVQSNEKATTKTRSENKTTKYPKKQQTDEHSKKHSIFTFDFDLRSVQTCLCNL